MTLPPVASLERDRADAVLRVARARLRLIGWVQLLVDGVDVLPGPEPANLGL